jgi:hypothetical protein
MAKLATLPTFKLLIKKINMITNAINYYIATITDTTATPITNNPIILYTQIVDTNVGIILLYSMPVAYASAYYVRVDELFKMPASLTINCTINSTVVNCKRVRPDLILVSNTIAHPANYINTITITYLHYNYREIYDTEQVHFSLFITSALPNTIVLYGSH